MSVARDRSRPVGHRRCDGVVGWGGQVGLCLLVFLVCAGQVFGDVPKVHKPISSNQPQGLICEDARVCKEASPPGFRHKASVAILSVGGALFVGSIIAAAIYGQHNKAKVEIDERGTRAYASELQAAYQTASTSGLIATVFWIATGATLATGLVVLGVEFASKPGPKAKRAGVATSGTMVERDVARLGAWTMP